MKNNFLVYPLSTLINTANQAPVVSTLLKTMFNGEYYCLCE